MFAIICNARRGADQGVEILALVDRSKSRKLWWVSDNPALMQVWKDRKEAEAKARSLQQNRARVVSASEAQHRLMLQAQYLEHAARAREDASCMDAIEAGWDGHKNAF